MKQAKTAFRLIVGSVNSRYADELDEQLKGLTEPEEQGVVDELRLDPLLDYYTDKMFGWLTVLMGEPKYFFLVPGVVEAITTYFRGKDSYKWERQTLEIRVQRELRYLEARVCDALSRSNGGEKGIIGINRWKKFWNNGDLPVTRESVQQTKGIQKSLGMHVTPRYLARTHFLFGNTDHLQRQAATDFIVGAIRDQSKALFWWQEIPVFNKIAAKYSNTFQEWLNEKVPTAGRLSLSLTSAESTVLREHLFGTNKKRKSWQQLIFSTKAFLVGPRANSNSSSQLLRGMARFAPKTQRKLLGDAAQISEAVGIVRYLYNLTIMQQDHTSMADDVRKLSKITLPNSITEETSYATGALAFLKECITLARKNKVGEIQVAICKREKDVKGERNRLYVHRNGSVQVKRTADVNKDQEPLLQEPPMRLNNVRQMLRRILERKSA